MIRVLVVDDHPVVRAGIVGLLESEADFKVVGEVESGEAAIALLQNGQGAELNPDVVLMDLRMPGLGGVESTRRIVEQAGPAGPRVLVFTTYEEDDQILAAVEAGASGYLLKAAPAAELVAGVRAVVDGQTVLAPSLAAQLASAVRGRAQSNTAADPSTGAKLTPRETEILALVAKGMSNPSIAANLHIGESTVKTHLMHVFEKLAVDDRTRAVTKAMELGLLS